MFTFITLVDIKNTEGKTGGNVMHRYIDLWFTVLFLNYTLHNILKFKSIF